MMRSLFALLAVAITGCSTMLVEPNTKEKIDEQKVQTQEILTPIALRLDLPAEKKAAHVFALYKTWGNKGWRDIELTRDGASFTGEISCREISTVTGDARYYLVALDDRGELVGKSGTPEDPHLTRIVSKVEDGVAVPIKCFDPDDCPSDFAGAGCPVHVLKRSSCDKDKDCGKNASCAWDGYCLSAPEREIPDGDLAAAVAAVRSRIVVKR